MGSEMCIRDSTKPRRAPDEPTQSERDQHEQEGCVNYRSWCIYCQAARGVSNPHLRRDPQDVQEELPTLHMDFCYLCDKPADRLLASSPSSHPSGRASEGAPRSTSHSSTCVRVSEGAQRTSTSTDRPDDIPEPCQPALACKDSHSGGMLGYMLPSKEADHTNVLILENIVKATGYRRIVLRLSLIHI